MHIKTTIKTDRDLSSAAGGNNAAFDLVEPGYYDAMLRKMTVSTHRAKFGKFASPDADGKWEYLKLLPDVQLLNEAKTLINRQQLTVGVLYEDELIRPDKDPEKLPVWGGTQGAQFLLQALGLFRVVEGGYELDLRPDIVVNRPLRVRTEIGGYIKGASNYDPAELTKLLLSIRGGAAVPFAEIRALQAQWNAKEGFTDPDGNEYTEGVSLRLKNIITGWYAHSPAQAEELGYYADEETGMIFADAETFTSYQSWSAQSDSDSPDTW